MMMKKLLILMLVFGMASVLQADSTGFTVEGYGSEYDGPLGVSIRIDLAFSGADWSATIWEGIVEASTVNTDGQALAADIVDMGGAVGSAVVYTSAAVAISLSGYQDNYNGNLLSTVAADTSSGALAAPGVSISFDYTLPATASSDWWVAPLKSGETYTYDGGSFTVGATYSNLEATNYPVAGLHIIPEPMTVLLLGLGGLFLRRRK